ncbi:hypothetical protein FGO68_gene12520 [Halteria grandinella]|uniref:C2 domain-containing protein n=1 Tax=Halteria grandinella TaxID=5974 RepID=A0A8J8SZ41_HALGN|nr:hypothetical protein FGO68_gene12520 [Halteria grandinella]
MQQFQQQQPGAMKTDLVSGGGRLIIRAIEGKLFRDTQMVGKMDPYLLLEYGGLKFKSKVASGGGKFPNWNETFELDICSVNDEIKLVAKDENIISDDFIGQAFIKVSSLIMNNGVRDWFVLSYQDKQAGQILLETQWFAGASKTQPLAGAMGTQATTGLASEKAQPYGQASGLSSSIAGVASGVAGQPSYGGGTGLYGQGGKNY